jgi:hypothetical protein
MAAGIFSLLGLALWTLGRPHWVTLSDAQFRAALHPELTKTERADPAAQERFRRLGELRNRLRHGFDDPKSAGDLESIRQLAQEGRLQRPSRMEKAEKPLPTAQDLRAIAEGFAAHGEREAKAGRAASAVRSFLTAQWLSEQIAETALEVDDLRDKESALFQVFMHLRASLRHLSRADLDPLNPAFSPKEFSDPRLPRILRRRLQEDLLPRLADPRAYARTHFPGKALDATLAGALQVLPGQVNPASYDARLTAENLNRIFVPMLGNTQRPIHAHVRAGRIAHARLLDSIPKDQSGGKTGWAWLWSTICYRWEVSQTRNLLGDQVLAIHGQDISEAFANAKRGEQVTYANIRNLIENRRRQLEAPRERTR